jgi:hypothetical protein
MLGRPEIRLEPSFPRPPEAMAEMPQNKAFAVGTLYYLKQPKKTFNDRNLFGEKIL